MEGPCTTFAGIINGKTGTTVNLPKIEFGHTRVVFLGHVIGQQCVTPVQAKVKVIALCQQVIEKSCVSLAWQVTIASSAVTFLLLLLLLPLY